MPYTKLDLKPLSTNESWKGRRFKTDKYKAFIRKSLLMLRPMKMPDSGYFTVRLIFGFSSAGSDVDNPVKMVLDILSKKFRFNDNLIYRLEVDKRLVDKGKEYYAFEITKMEPEQVSLIDQRSKMKIK